MSHTIHDIPDAGIGTITLPHHTIFVILTYHRLHRWRPSVSTPVGAGSSTTGRAQLFRWLRPYILNVFGHGEGRGYEDDRKLESGCRRHPYICASLSSNLVLHTDSIVIDRFILCRCCVLDLSVDSRYSTEPTGHLELLPREHLRDSCRPKSI